MVETEACRVIRADALATAGCFRRVFGEGVLHYRVADDAPETAVAEWRVETVVGERTLTLRFPAGDGLVLDETMALEWTAGPWGRRWWLRCGGWGCGRRCGALYLAPRERHYRCRTCARLTYATRRASWRSRSMDRQVAARMGIAVRGLRALHRRRRERGWGT